MKALTVDFGLIAQSMRDIAREYNEYFLNKHTGQVISLSRDLIRALTRENLEERESLPEWDEQMIPLARKIVLGGSKEYIRIPEILGRPDHQFQLQFTQTVRSSKLKQRLGIALKGRGSNRRFKEILKEIPEESQRWGSYYENCWKEKVTHWLESVGILAFSKRVGSGSTSGS